MNRGARGRALGTAPVIMLIALAAAAAGASLLAGTDPSEMTAGVELRPPSFEHPFGTDEYGRDLWSRTLHGLRLSFVVGVLSTVLGGGAGLALGAVAGYRGGKVDAIAMRAVDGLLAIPAILLGIAVVAALGPGVRNVTVTLAIVQFPVFARLTRGAILAEKEEEYVQAAVSVGARPLRILVRHILRNGIAPVVVQAALAIGFSVLVEASLSFLGLGIRPPEPSLGSILDASRSVMRHAVWYPLLPGAVLVLLLYALNGAADTLNDLLNPRQR